MVQLLGGYLGPHARDAGASRRPGALAYLHAGPAFVAGGPDREMRHAQLLQAALAVAHGQALPERVGPAQQYVVDHAQRVGPGPERAAHRRAVGQRQAVGLGGDQRRRPGHERRERHAGAAPGPAEAAQLADRRVEADVGLAPAVVPLERLLRRERAGPQYVPADRKHRIHQSPLRPSACTPNVSVYLLICRLSICGTRHPCRT